MSRHDAAIRDRQLVRPSRRKKAFDRDNQPSFAVTSRLQQSSITSLPPPIDRIQETSSSRVKIVLGHLIVFFLLRRPRARALLFHQLFETGNIDSESALARHQFRQVERKTIRVVKFEREMPGNFVATLRSIAMHPFINRPFGFLKLNHVLDSPMAIAFSFSPGLHRQCFRIFCQSRRRTSSLIFKSLYRASY